MNEYNSNDNVDMNVDDNNNDSSSSDDSEPSPPLSPSCIVAVYERGYSSPKSIGKRYINNYDNFVSTCNQLQQDFNIDNFEHDEVESEVEQDE